MSMGYAELETNLNMKNRIFGVKRIYAEDGIKSNDSCVIKLMNHIFQGEETIFTVDSCKCFGYSSNAGFKTGRPEVKGGIEYFLSCGRGEGFPPGERIKKTPEIALAYYDNDDRDVLKPYNAYKVFPYEEGCDAEIVWMFATPDQLSPLTILYEFRSSDSTNDYIVSFASACGSLFAQPFAQLKKEHPKAIIGCTDIAARPYLDSELLSMAITHDRFKEMLEDTSDCFFHGAFWNNYKDRLKHRK